MEDQCGFDCLGAEDYSVGVDYGSLLQAAGGLATAGVSAAEQAKKESQDSATRDKNVKAAVAADQAAASAIAQAAVSAAAKLPSASIDAQAAQLATTAEDTAAAALDAEGQKKRADAADATLAAVVKVAQQKPTDVNQKALVAAWTQIANKAHSGAITGKGGKSGLDSYGGQNWFTKPVLGKIPGYGVLLLGAGVLGAGWLVVKKFVMKKVRG